MAILLFLIVVPFILFLSYSAFQVADFKIDYTPTTKNYSRFVTEEPFLRVFGSTLLLCGAVTISTIVASYPTAYYATRLSNKYKLTLVVFLLLPLLMSYVLKIYSMRMILGSNGFLNRMLLSLGVVDEPLGFLIFNKVAIFLTLTMLMIPFAFIPIYLALERIPKNLYESSLDLGASELTTFLRVALPMTVSGIITAAIFVFVISIGDFLTPQMMGGRDGFTFGRIIFSQFGAAFNWPFGSALSVVLLVFLLPLLIISQVLSRGGK